MGIRQANIDKAEQDQLLTFMRKHPIFPFRKVFNLQCNGTNFSASAGTMNGNSSEQVNYATLSWTPQETVGIVSLAGGFIIAPNTVVDVCGIVVSFKPTCSIAHMTAAAVDEGNDIYQLLSNGGAINDFQVSYPLNWLVEKSQTLYVHLLLGKTTTDVGTAAMVGHVLFGCLKGGI